MRALARIISSGLLTIYCAGTFAASLEITPVTVELEANQNGQVFTLHNNGTEALNAQIRVYSWNQEDGDDQLTLTRDLIASPPIAQVAAGGEQIVRLVRAHPGGPAQEMAYRLFIDELPPPNAAPSTGIQFRFRYSVPVFLYPAGERGAPDTHWSLETHEGKWRLRVRNSGSLHARLSDVSLSVGGNTVPVRTGLLGYALAGRERVFPLALSASALRNDGASVQATVNINGKTSTVPVSYAR